MSTTIPIGTESWLGSPPPPIFPAYGGDGDQYVRRVLRRYRLGLALFVAALVMLFVGFSSAYVVRRDLPTFDAGSGSYSANWEPLQLPIALLLGNTVILLAASVSMEIARRQSHKSYLADCEGKGEISFLWINSSLLLAALFIADQGFAWRVMQVEGHLLSTGARTAFFYVLTGTHAFHALIGMLLLGWIVVRQGRWSTVRRYFAIDLTAWYLHSMTVLWIYLLCFLLFA